MDRKVGPDSREYEVLMHIQAVTAYSEMHARQGEIYSGDPGLMDEIDDSPWAEYGTLLELVERHLDLMNDDASGWYVHPRRADVWSMVSAADREVNGLAKIKSLLEPLMEGAAL
jgi:hypothetical protein